MRLTIVVLAVAAFVLMYARPATAACSSAVPSFMQVARTAEQVVIGTVSDGEPTGPNQYASVFRVTVERVLGGPRQTVIEARDLVTNPACGTLVLARDGDRIALAIGGTAFGYAKRVSAIAYVAGVPHRPDIESMTLAEVYAAVGVPDTAVSRVPPQDGKAGWLVVAAAAAATVLALRSRRASRSSP
jgi:hypothetical protein